MKKSELKTYLREEIISMLSEEESVKDIQDKAKAQSELNKELEKTKELTTESLNPEVIKAVNRFIKEMAKRYDYSEQDAVFAIEQALAKRQSSVPTDMPGFEGTMDALDSISIREEEEDEFDMAEKEPSKKELKKGDSVSKIGYKLAETSKEMKSIVKKYKDAQEPEKSKLLSRLKELTKIKKELEGLL
jgi:hypothetical protein